MTSFKFKEPLDTAVFTCTHVVDDNHSILLVTHDHDGDWQFLCGHGVHGEEDARMMSLAQAVELDNGLNGLFEMPVGVGAERKDEGDKWVPFRL